MLWLVSANAYYICNVRILTSYLCSAEGAVLKQVDCYDNIAGVSWKSCPFVPGFTSIQMHRLQHCFCLCGLNVSSDTVAKVILQTLIIHDICLEVIMLVIKESLCTCFVIPPWCLKVAMSQMAFLEQNAPHAALCQNPAQGQTALDETDLSVSPRVPTVNCPDSAQLLVRAAWSTEERIFNVLLLNIEHLYSKAIFHTARTYCVLCCCMVRCIQCTGHWLLKNQQMDHEIT